MGSFIKRIPLPSGITAAMGQETAAMDMIKSRSGSRFKSGKTGGIGGRRKKRTKSTGRKRGKRTTKARKIRKTGRATGAKLVKGSAAAKAWGRKMKSLRKG